MRELARRIKCRYTPPHGSWLQVRETGGIAGRDGGVDWQATVADARWNLKSGRPQIAS